MELVSVKITLSSSIVGRQSVEAADQGERSRHAVAARERTEAMDLRKRYDKADDGIGADSFGYSESIRAFFRQRAIRSVGGGERVDRNRKQFFKISLDR